MREYIAIFGLLMVLSLSGCVGLTTYEAPEPTVDNQTLNNTGYELAEQEEIVLNQSIRVSDIKITSNLNSYERQNPTNQSISFPPSRYVAVSTPSVSIAGTQLNPIILDPTDSTFQHVEERANTSIELGEQTDTLNRTHVSQENVTIEKYNGTIEIPEVGANFDATVLSAVVETDDAVLVMLGAYPERAGEQQEVLVEMMMNTTTVSNSSESPDSG